MRETEILHGSGELGKSRSQKKRESSALQELGEKLAKLGPARLEKYPLPPELKQAILTWKNSNKKDEAARRQMQYIGRLMRERDEEWLEEIRLRLREDPL
ncbi:MAG: DUF615 domain-containing protein [Deltaproteobacteria bacterium]|jgi:ribosome-associated protein|nr:DUF615 domain-containing protein [Deltaproteobacteria bacterium]